MNHNIEVNCDHNVCIAVVSNDLITCVDNRNVNCGLMWSNGHDMVRMGSSSGDKNLALVASPLSQKENVMPVKYDDVVFGSQRNKEKESYS